MKKIALSLASVLVATAFAPEVSALPLFARQTGRACNSCHYQHFPLLTAVGQDFKSSGFTQVNGKGKFKSEDLSITDNLNLGVYTTTYFQTQAHGTTDGVTNTAAVDGNKWGVPGNGGELSLFLGGRVSDFAGFLAEAGLGGGGAGAPTSSGGVVGPAKLVMLFPVGDSRVGTVIFTSTDQGVAYSFENLNTGAVAVHKMMGNGGPNGQHVNAAYAAQYLGTATAATGLAFVATGGMGFVNVAAYEAAGNDATKGANNLNLTYIRVASTMNFGDWEAGFGIQNFGGKSTVTAPTGAQYYAPKATVVDGQLQGSLGTMPVGFYVGIGSAAASTATEANPFNTAMDTAGGKAKTTFNFAAEFGVLPHTTVQAGLRLAKNGVDSGLAADGVTPSGTSQTDNALMLGVTYQLAQNILLSFHHTQQSGSAWNAQMIGGVLNSEPVGKDANTLLLQTSF